MKLKDKLAIEAVEARDFIHNETRRSYGEGFLAGLEKARELCILIGQTAVDIDDCISRIEFMGEEEVE